MRNVRLTDLVVIVGAVAAAQGIRFGSEDVFGRVGTLGIPFVVLPVTVVLLWKLALRLAHSDDRRVMGTGAQEYNRVINASLGLVGALALVGMMTNVSVSRGYWAIVFTVGTFGLLVSRWLWRKRIAAGRRAGVCRTNVLVLGEADSAREFIAHLAANTELGFDVVGVCIPGARPSAPPLRVRVRGSDRGDSAGSVWSEVPVCGDVTDARAAVEAYGATSVAVTSTNVLGHAAMRELSWQLDAMDVEMLVAPSLLAFAGPRIMMRPETGMPLLYIERPRYERATRALKSTFDVALAAVALLVLSPVMLGCALAVKFSDGGPVFYRAERIGRGNTPFRMWKFRTMVVGADSMRDTLTGLDDGNGVLFKIREDPRVTRVGRVLRRYSLDELPQLFNVLGRTMSLVGPRPPLSSEVATYDQVVTRRLLVRPGITGLWQVSGRSDLSWEASVHLDIAYVENWSLPGDLIILWRTAHAVLAADGAY